MQRRTFLKFAALATLFSPSELFSAIIRIKAEKEKKIFNLLNINGSGSAKNVLTDTADGHIKDYLTKIRHPNTPHANDIILHSSQLVLLNSVVARLQRVRATAGHGNFCVLGFDDALRIGRRYAKVGRFSRRELDFMEMVYYLDAGKYGFRGKKQIVTLGQKINRRDVSKIPYSGNYLFKGESFAKYEKVKRDLGEDLILTSGIRGVTKQFYLFLNKAYRYGGNLSLASRSLAPPGYSYHATGDFDVGQKGFGGSNFSEKFITSTVFKSLTRKGFVKYRYERDNMLGVRYEPWHIKL